MGKIKQRIKRIFGLHGRKPSRFAFENASFAIAHQYRDYLLSQPKYQDPKKLNRYGFRVYSESEEDGIIQEIFRRIGTTNKVFIEFGVERGIENNTVKLLLEGWKGLWLEGNSKFVEAIHQNMKSFIDQDRLRVVQAFIDKDNIDSLLEKNTHEKEIDLLGVDIDGNDFYILNQIHSVRPRVIVSEYNAKFAPPVDWVMQYNPTHRWKGDDYFGASLKAYENLLDHKGYALVGCTLSGSNAFYVRKDLLKDHFLAPYTAENHYEPVRYWLIPGYRGGHPVAFHASQTSHDAMRLS